MPISASFQVIHFCYRAWSKASFTSLVCKPISRMWHIAWEQTEGCTIRLGLLLAAVSGVLMTLYSFMIHNIKGDVDRNMVLLLRGILQAAIMAVWSWNNGLSFLPSVSRQDRIAVFCTWLLVFCATRK